MKKLKAKLIGFATVVAFGISIIFPMKSNAQKDTTNTKNDKMKINISSSIVSDYVAKGYVLGKGPHKQDYVGINKNNFTTFFWSDYDFKDKYLREIDLGIKYSKKINDQLSSSLAFIYMNYPKGDDDKVLSFNLIRKGKINSKLSLINFFKDKEIPNGILLEGELSKKIFGKNDFTMGAKIKGVCTNNFYGDYGFSNVTPGIDFRYSGKKLNFEGFMKYQFGFIPDPKMLPPAKNQFYAGVKFSKRF
jgi:hypothetical protein